MTRAALAWGLLLVAGCATGPKHHIRRIGDRRVARAEPCAAPPIHADHGPDTPHEAIAVVTAECRESQEALCREELQRGVCEANADALIDTSNGITSGGRRRMVGTAVEYQTTAPH